MRHLCLLTYLMLMTAVVFTEDGIGGVAPKYVVAFHPACEKGASNCGIESRVEKFAEMSEKGAAGFDGVISGFISSRDVRIGGGRIGIKGAFFDRTTKGVFHLGCGSTVGESGYSFRGLPIGRYLLTVDVEGKSVYVGRIAIAKGGDAQRVNVVIPSYSDFSGKISGVPVWSVDSPIVGCETGMALVGRTGEFRLTVALGESDSVFVRLKFANPSPKEWDRPIYRLDYLMRQVGPKVEYTVPETTGRLVARGRVVLVDRLLAEGLGSLVQNATLVVEGIENLVVFRCSPDDQGRFNVYGLPAGRYRVRVDEYGGPPFVSNEVNLEVGESGELPSITVTLDLVGAQ